MNKKRLSLVPSILGLLLLLPGMSHQSMAFPPAPHHEIFGMIRDELGHPLDVEGARVLFEAPNGVTHITGVVPNLRSGVNYRFFIPLDSGVTAERYRPSALEPHLPFRIRVLIDGEIYLPIEMNGDSAFLGGAAEASRLDLTLGEDLDGDGLPDQWERWLLGEGGLDVELASVDPRDDADNDGMSNRDEYLAGTYAHDPQNGFRLNLIEANDEGLSRVEFMAVRGRTYSIRGTQDFENWTPVSFVLEEAETAVEKHWVADTRLMKVTIKPDEELPALRFFQLLIE